MQATILSVFPRVFRDAAAFFLGGGGKNRVSQVLVP